MESLHQREMKGSKPLKQQALGWEDDVPMYVVGVNHTEYKKTDTVAPWLRFGLYP